MKPFSSVEDGFFHVFVIAGHVLVGFLASNTRHCTPLECRRGAESCSIDIALLWSAGIKFVALLRTLGISIALLVQSRDPSLISRVDRTL